MNDGRTPLLLFSKTWVSVQKGRLWGELTTMEITSLAIAAGKTQHSRVGTNVTVKPVVVGYLVGCSVRRRVLYSACR